MHQHAGAQRCISIGLAPGTLQSHLQRTRNPTANVWASNPLTKASLFSHSLLQFRVGSHPGWNWIMTGMIAGTVLESSPQ